jgi:hypothetical protein
MKWIYAAALFLLATQPASAGFMDAKELSDLYELQGTPDNRSPVYPKLYGYVIGVHDLGESILWCAPDGTRVAQVLKVVQNHISAHPESWNNSAAEEISKALKAAWPCPAK